LEEEKDYERRKSAHPIHFRKEVRRLQRKREEVEEKGVEQWCQLPLRLELKEKEVQVCEKRNGKRKFIEKRNAK